MEPTYTMARDQKGAARRAQAMMNSENADGITLQTQDEGRQANYCIYIYNILNMQHIVEAGDKYPRFVIPACPPHEKFAYTTIAAFTKDRHVRPGTSDYYYKQVDGRKDATALLNPSAFPGTQWEAQLANWESLDQAGNNLNALGCFWSTTEPDDLEHLEVEIKMFRDYATRTMENLVRQAELFVAAGKLTEVTPRMHFAMDYLGKQAPWHMTMTHHIACPNCGASIKEGIAYHKNDFGDKCIVDMVRYVKLFPASPEALALKGETPADSEPEAPAPRRKRNAA